MLLSTLVPHLLVPSALVLLSADAVTPGDHRVVYDRAEVKRIAWDVACGEVPAPDPLPRGTIFAAQIDGDEVRFAGPGRRFGTDVCDGATSTLQVKSKARGAFEARVRCETGRVVRGVESTDSLLRLLDDRRVEVFTHSERRWRTAGESCGVLIERRTVLEPAKQAASVHELVDAAARDVDLAEVVVRHDVRLDGVLRLVSSRVLLDQKPIAPRGGDPAAGGALLDGLLPKGDHVLSVEVLVEVGGAGTPMRVRMRDTLFFQAGDAPTRIDVVTDTSKRLFAEPHERLRMRFFVDGVERGNAETARR